MSKIRFLHTADLHLDSPFEGLPRGKAAQRRKEQRELLGRIAELSETENCDFVLMAGDLLDSDSSYPETCEELIRALGRVSVPVFISPGNHDYYSEKSVYAKLNFPENVHIFKSKNIECITLPESNVRVWGAAFADVYMPPMLEGFKAEKMPDTLDVMCIHGELASSSRYDPISENSIAASGMDYLALGHIHKGSGLMRAGECFYSWPGCPEGRGFDECGEKCVYMVELGDGNCTVKPVSVAKRRYEILPVALGDNSPLDAINAALPADTENDIYRIILRGETENAPDLAALKSALESRFYSLQLKDETSIRRDVWESAGEDSLKGQFLLRLKTMYDESTDGEERKKLTQAARWGLAALTGREEVVRHDD